MGIYTSRYSNKELADGKYYCVGISIGTPKFKLAYRLENQCYSLAPTGYMLRMNLDVFAEWWVENTGEIIEELPDPNPPKGKKVATASKKPEVQTKPDDGYQQMSLFGMGTLI